MKNQLYPAQVGTQYFGEFRANVSSMTTRRPIEGARVTISYESVTSGVSNRAIEQLFTNNIGRTQIIELPTPPLDYSLAPSEIQPYTDYNVLVEAPGYIPVEITGSQVLPEVMAIQPIVMMPTSGNGFEDVAQEFVIPANRLFGDFPPKIAEDEIKRVEETGEIVLSEVVIPEYIVVHDGPPRDTNAKNHYVRYRDYIKNVASSEIYATWPQAAIFANILAIQSFTLNRVYTEWYRNRGYNFTITSSTAYDHKWVPGRNIFDTISTSVDVIFNNFLSRPGIQQPILTQYCDGRQVTCPGWMTQWGSKYLADNGYQASEIIRYYYGDDMYINQAMEVAGVPVSWPGYNLLEGTSGASVRQIQNQLNVVSNGYPLIPKVTVDGIFGPQTKRSVTVFQEVFGLPASGIVDFPTWYKISEIYVGVSRIAELN